MPGAKPEVLAKFRSLNPHLSGWAKPGQLAVMSDPRNVMCTYQEAALMDAAAKVDAALTPMTDAEAKFYLRHREEVETFLGNAATGIGTAATMTSKHLGDVKNTLVAIEQLHQRSFNAQGHLRSASFHAERGQLMRQLDASLGPLVRKGIRMPDHPSLKHALGLSSRSLVHHWSRAGRAGAIPGYSTHIRGVAQATTYLKSASYLGIALDSSVTASRIHAACTQGRESECREVSYTEGGRLSGSVGGSMAGGAIAAKIAAPVCIAIGVGTVGLGGLVCGVVVTGIGGIVGGTYGAKHGQSVGEIVYEQVK